MGTVTGFGMLNLSILGTIPQYSAEDAHTPVGSIEHAVHRSTQRNPPGSWHADDYTALPTAVKADSR